VAIGITAVPTPVTDYGTDLWFMIEQLEGATQVATQVGFREYGKDRYFDSKAMRKVDLGQDVAIVAETTAFQIGTLLTTSFRCLVKLH